MEHIGRFQVTGEVGRGGEGVVYSAFDPTIGRKVAIKALLVGNEKASAALRARLRQEAMNSGKLSHPSIVTVHEFIEQDNGAYLVMEFVEGITLADRMEEPATESVMISLLGQIADALDYAHSEGLVHRDVKPANMLVTNRGILKVTDFGIAKLLNDTIAGGATQTGFVRGTAHYLSPEQIEQKGISGQSDQFSLAVIAYQWLSGRKPFDGESWTSLLYQILHVEPQGVNRPDQAVDPDVTAVLLKALSKNPANRYTTCREFINGLESSLGVASDTAVFAAYVPGTPTGTRRRTATKEVKVEPPPAKSIRGVWIGVALASVIGVAGIGWRVMNPGKPDVPATAPSKSTVTPARKDPTPVEKPAELVAVPSSKLESAVSKPEKAKSKEAKPAPKTEAKQQAAPPVAPPPPVVETPPPVVETPAPTGRYLGPPAGRFTWSGTLGGGQNLTISVAGATNRPSSGAIEGRGIPYNLAVSISAQPGEIRVAQRPSASNGYQLVLRNTSANEIKSITVQWREEKE